MKILLTGRAGQVGWELEQVLPSLGNVISTDRAALDLADAAAIKKKLSEVKPDIIVNAAAYTAVDKAESEPQRAMQVNGVAPGVLAGEAKRLGALLVHYSTDYVFDGTKALPYVEDDVPNPISTYGKTKLAGERAVQASGCRHLILRTSWVYGPRGRNFYRAIAARAAAGELLRVVDDQRGVPTPGRFLAEETLALLRKDASGMLHLVPCGETTWYGFAQEILRQKHSRASLSAIKSGEFQTAARRPANAVLDNRKAAAILGRPLRDWQSLLAAVRESP